MTRVRFPPPAPESIRINWAYWLFITPFVTGNLTRITTLTAIGLLSGSVQRPVLQLEFWVSLPLALLLADFVGYWSHRLRHTRMLWRFHAIHHSPTQLNALAAARMHPIDDVIDNTLVGATLFLAGFSAQTIFAIGPILFVHIALIHSAKNWTFGPLGKVFVSPAFHRKHHQVGAVGNYSGMFSFIDVLFGTCVNGGCGPHGSGEPIPEDLYAHLMWPFRKLRKRSLQR